MVIGVFQEQLVLCDWLYRHKRKEIDKRLANFLNTTFVEKETKTGNATQVQLEEYFNGKRKEFHLPTLSIGSEFQKKVWNALKQITYGETSSYLELSKSLGNILAIRAVAAANGANALAIIVPCHRIIGANKELVGYAGGTATKRKLLELENPYWNSNQIPLFGT